MPTDVHVRLNRPIDPNVDHVRGGAVGQNSVSVLIYGDYLCPYCRRIRIILARLHNTLGDGMNYVFRQFPNEKAHPGSEFAALAAEAAGRQGKFWPMHDALYNRKPPLNHQDVEAAAASIGLDMQRFAHDLHDPAIAQHIADDVADGRSNGVTGTPTIFIDGRRYDGAWDFHSMLEEIQSPVAARVQRTARVFANLPTSAGLVLLSASLLALLCANTVLAPAYLKIIGARIGIGLDAGHLSLTFADWVTQGFLTLFFLLVGLELRRELTVGAFLDRRAAVLPVVGAVGGVLIPAAIYLAINHGATARGWSAPTSTGIAFTLGVLAVLGRHAPVGVKTFVAALAVIDDILSVLTLAIFYPKDFHPVWLLASLLGLGAMFALNRWRVFAGWPYLVATVVLWLSLHASGVDAALAGIVLATFLPTRPVPAVGPLLAQAATALAALEHAELDEGVAARTMRPIVQAPVWQWASRNLSAASARLLSPADRVERAFAPWSTYVGLPLFAFCATGTRLSFELHSADDARVFAGVVLGLVVGKPLGICLAAVLAVKANVATMPTDTPLRTFLGATILCGVSDPVALLMADLAFPTGDFAPWAKLGVLAGSIIAACLGALVIVGRPFASPLQPTPSS